VSKLKRLLLIGSIISCVYTWIFVFAIYGLISFFKDLLLVDNNVTVLFMIIGYIVISIALISLDYFYLNKLVKNEDELNSFIKKGKS